MTEKEIRREATRLTWEDAKRWGREWGLAFAKASWIIPVMELAKRLITGRW